MDWRDVGGMKDMDVAGLVSLVMKKAAQNAHDDLKDTMEDVKKAIRNRVDSGDTGTPAEVSGFSARRWWIVRPTLGVIVLLLTGGALAFGTTPPALIATTPTATATTSPTPRATQTAARPTPTVSPSPTLEPTAAPEPAPAPPPADTTPPVVVSASSPPIFGANGGTPTISAVVTDDSGVAAVSIAWSGVLSGSSSMNPAWSYILAVPPSTPAGSLEFIIQAVDAAGNLSAPFVLQVPVGN